MKRVLYSAATTLLLIAGAVSSASGADIEVTAPDGRRILLQQNGTWRFIEGRDTHDGVESKALLLGLERRVERDRSCRFAVRLTNNLPYEVQSLVLSYTAYRADGRIYDTVSPGAAFSSLKPSDSQTREFEFFGLACKDISRVQVVGGDRCSMGDLNKWSDQTERKGHCLARVRVEESKLVRFDK
jgi:hypothetical protein